MRAAVSIVVILFVAVCAFGQSRQGSTATIPSVPFEILDQSDSPLQINVDEKAGRLMSGAALRVTNNSASNVNAFVIRIKGGGSEQNYLVFVVKGIAPRSFHLQGASIPKVTEGEERPVVSIDFVHFDDGASWGADTLGRSKDVQAFLAGRALALSRLKELLSGQDDSDFMKSIDAFRSSSFGETVTSVHRAPQKMDFGMKGYEEIINILRRMSSRTDEAKDLARKLELMKL